MEVYDNGSEVLEMFTMENVKMVWYAMNIKRVLENEVKTQISNIQQ